MVEREWRGVGKTGRSTVSMGRLQLRPLKGTRVVNFRKPLNPFKKKERRNRLFES